MIAKKKVIFCTYSSIYSSIVLKQLIDDETIDLVAIINSTRVFRPSLNPLQGAITQLKISGLRYSAYLFMITDLFRFIQPLLKLKRVGLKSVHALARIHNISIINTRDINSEIAIHFIKNHKPDFLLCAHFNQLLKAPVLNIKDIECVNIHPSLLPQYKGVDPVFYAMKDDTEEIGVSVHKMDESFDTGDILIQSSIKTVEGKSLLFNNCQLFEEGIKLALKWMKNEIPTETMIVKKNDLQSYDSWPTRADIRDFRKSGKRLISLSDLWNQV